MTREAFERGEWAAVIQAHPLESHDPDEWLRYGVALLHTLMPGPDAGKQQQQAALAFIQAQKEGATAEAVRSAQWEAVTGGVARTLYLAGVRPLGPLVDQHSVGHGASGLIPDDRLDSAAMADGRASGGDGMQQVLVVLAGMFGLTLAEEGSSQLDQIVLIRRQLQEQGVGIDVVETKLLSALKGGTPVQLVAARQLLDLLN